MGNGVFTWPVLAQRHPQRPILTRARLLQLATLPGNLRERLYCRRSSERCRYCPLGVASFVAKGLAWTNDRAQLSCGEGFDVRKTLLLVMATAWMLPAGAQKADDWYPQSITAPAGHQYPCALTALPKDLTGIPQADRRFINHTYAMILKCLQAKLVMIDTLFQDNQSYTNAYAVYYRDVAAARQRIMSEPVPAGCEAFRNTVVAAIDKQIQYFGKATTKRGAGGSSQDVLNLPEGRTASGLLQQAWSQMASKYPSMSPAVHDSTYHHLCALDVF